MEEKGSYIVRIVCQNNSKFVQFTEDELNVKNFPEKVANIFGIKFGDIPYSGLILTDNLGFPIPKQMLAEIVKKFHSGSMFYINVEYQISNSLQGNVCVITESMLTSYFRRQNKAGLLLNKMVKVLDDKVRMQIVNCIVDFMVEAFGKGDPSKVTKQQKMQTARATIMLFEGLKSTDQTDELGKLLGAHGFFTTRLKYLKSKQNELNARDEVTDQVSSQLAQLQLSPEDDLQFLKSCVVKNTDQNVLISKLKSTQKLRENMMRDANVDLRMSFPFFFAEPHLIVLDFANNPNFACDSTAFLDNWPKYGLKVRELVDKNIATDWNSDVENLLLLLHVFPSKSKRLPLRDAMKKLIVFRVSGTTPGDMIEKSNQHPYIVAYGTSQKEVISFYIEAERHLIPLPPGYNMMQTFDVFFKLHFVLGLDFDKALENMALFIQRLIFNLRKGKSSTACMQTFLEKLL